MHENKNEGPLTADEATIIIGKIFFLESILNRCSVKAHHSL